MELFSTTLHSNQRSIIKYKVIHLDFEISAHKAALSVFPNVKIMACRFHLRQSWWRFGYNNIIIIILI